MDLRLEKLRGWLPDGKVGAVCFTIDDVHPGTSQDAYEAGGDLGRGALGHVEWLLQRHPKLRVTLFVTADWRELSPSVSRTWLAKVPLLRDRVYLTSVRPRGAMRLDRHTDFVRYVTTLPRTECELHGLEHVNRGFQIPREFAGRSAKECERRLREAVRIFGDAGMPQPAGFCPPAWELTPELHAAVARIGLRFVASGRDIRTPVSEDAKNGMSGLMGASLLYPERLPSGLVHFTTNFQGTSTLERAEQIIECGGVLAIKAHIVKDALGFVMRDGLDAEYRERLHTLFCTLEDHYGDRLWWTSMRAIADRCRSEHNIIQEDGIASTR